MYSKYFGKNVFCVFLVVVHLGDCGVSFCAQTQDSKQALANLSNMFGNFLKPKKVDQTADVTQTQKGNAVNEQQVIKPEDKVVEGGGQEVADNSSGKGSSALLDNLKNGFSKLFVPKEVRSGAKSLSQVWTDAQETLKMEKEKAVQESQKQSENPSEKQTEQVQVNASEQKNEQGVGVNKTIESGSQTEQKVDQVQSPTVVVQGENNVEVQTEQLQVNASEQEKVTEQKAVETNIDKKDSESSAVTTDAVASKKNSNGLSDKLKTMFSNFISILKSLLPFLNSTKA